MSDRASSLLQVVNRVRELNEGLNALGSSPVYGEEFPREEAVIEHKRKREEEDEEEEIRGGESSSQPLDFSKKIKTEGAGSPEYSGHHLGSDGHSDNASNSSGHSPHVSPAPHHLMSPLVSSTPLPPAAATLNLLSVLQQQQKLPIGNANTLPYNPLLLAAASSNFSPHPQHNLSANLAELSKVSSESKESFQKFRETMLQKIESSRPKGRRSSSNNSNNSSSFNASPEQLQQHGGALKDDAYWERRKKNNEAAKRSRDARRNKENEVAVRAQFLEQENIQLKMELASLRSEILNLRDEVYKNNGGSLESLSGGP